MGRGVIAFRGSSLADHRFKDQNKVTLSGQFYVSDKDSLLPHSHLKGCFLLACCDKQSGFCSLICRKESKSRQIFMKIAGIHFTDFIYGYAI